MEDVETLNTGIVYKVNWGGTESSTGSEALKETENGGLAMFHPIKVAEINLSFFTGENTRLVLTAEESEHGYDYNMTYYSDSSNPISVIEEHHMFYDQVSADNAMTFMAAKVKEILG